MLLMIDNYDSFTYNLVQYFGELGQEVKVFHQRRHHLAGNRRACALLPGHFPGPCAPAQAEFRWPIREFSGKIPLGCLSRATNPSAKPSAGHVVHTKKLMHGKVSPVHHQDRVSSAACPIR